MIRFTGITRDHVNYLLIQHQVRIDSFRGLSHPEKYAETHLPGIPVDPRSYQDVFGPIQVKYPERFRSNLE